MYDSTNFIKLAQKEIRINCLENFYIKLQQHHNILIYEQNTGEQNLSIIIWYPIERRMRVRINTTSLPVHSKDSVNSGPQHNKHNYATRGMYSQIICNVFSVIFIRYTFGISGFKKLNY
jgi:hypothetical protein